MKLAALKMKIEQMGHAPRVEKRIISTVLSTAFSEVKAARQALTGLEEPPPHGG